MKILEQVMYNRIAHQVEPQLYAGQYAYRRSLGTEHHLTMLLDFTHRALLENQQVNVVSYDIASAFDCIPHGQLIRPLHKFGVDLHTTRLIPKWLQGRSYMGKQRTPAGEFSGRQMPKSCGLPRGGVLSPAS